MKHAVSILPDGGKDRDWGEITHELEITEAWLADLIAAPPPGPDSKDELSAWVPGRFDGRRSVPTAIDRSLLGIDFDHVEDCDVVLDRFTRLGLRAFVHASFTVRNEDGTWRFRAYVPLDRPATSAEWPRVAGWTLSTFPEADTSCRDISRLFYLPVAREGYWSEVIEGAALVVDSLPAIEAAVASPAPVVERAGAPSGDAAAVLASCWPARGRHTAQMALAGALCRDGWPEHRALDFLCDVCRRAGDEDRPKREKTIQRTYKLAREGGSTTGWTALEKSVPAAVVSAARAILRGGEEDERAFAELVGAAVTPVTPRPDQGIFWDNWDEPLPPIEWLVEGLIPKGTVGGFVAHGSSLKTWTVLSIGAAVARGRAWLEKFPVKQGKVVILDYESGQYEIRRRIRVLEQGKVIGLGAWSYPTKRIDDTAFWIELGAIEGVVLLCVDSLAEGSSPGVDENDRGVAFPLQLAARYSEATGAAVLFVHHSKKDDGGDARKVVRGSSAIYAAFDWCYAFENVEETTTSRRMLMTSIKPCMGAKPAPVPLELTDKGLTSFEMGQKPTKASPPEVVQEAIRLRLAGGPIESKAKIATAIGLRRELVTPEVDAMLVRGEIVFLRGEGFALDSPERRLERVLAVVRGYQHWSSPGKIAKAAQTNIQVVEEAIRVGLLCRSADGRFLVVEKVK